MASNICARPAGLACAARLLDRLAGLGGVLIGRSASKVSLAVFAPHSVSLDLLGAERTAFCFVHMRLVIRVEEAVVIVIVETHGRVAIPAVLPLRSRPVV